MKHIILASGSPRRKELLESIGVAFEVIPSEYEEDNNLPLLPDKLVETLSLGKASWVAERYSGAVIIAADTLVSVDDLVLGKPKDEQELKKMLRRLSGRSHVVYTGFTISEGEHVITDSAATTVFFREITDKEIEHYVNAGSWLDLAGGYNIQGLAAVFVDKIEGTVTNVVGLPIDRLVTRLKEFDVEVLS